MDASYEADDFLPMSSRVQNLVRPEPVEGLTTNGNCETTLLETQWLQQSYPITVAGAVPDSLPSTR